ncbi:MAG: orotate phosphoribosyltransferase [Pseudomonadota bacterium]
MEDNNHYLDLYRSNNALLEGHFLLSSGLHSDRYLQSALLLQHPQHAATLCQGLADKLPSALREQISVVVGPAMGAVLVSYETARALGVRSLFTERQDGQMTLRRGFTLQPGEKILVVEDVITTGGSTKECIRALEAAGGQVIAVASLVDRSGGSADFGTIPFHPLIRLNVQTWFPDQCPLCSVGSTPVKPGSRGLK